MRCAGTRLLDPRVGGSVASASRWQARGQERWQENGAASLEFAVLLPLLLLVVFGIIDLGRAMNTQISVTHAAREGVRASLLGRDDVARIVREAAGPLVASPTVTVTPCPTVASPTDTTTVITSTWVHFITPLSAFLPGAPEGVRVTGRGTARCLA